VIRNSGENTIAEGVKGDITVRHTPAIVELNYTTTEGMFRHIDASTVLLIVR
jgi:hypothetical protein